MNNKKSVIDRLDQLKVESGLSDKAFKQTLSSITGKNPRTIRRWFALESNIHENDIELIAQHFGKHVHWLRYGDRANVLTAVDQIMSSDHFGVVIIKDGKAEETNFKFTEMMDLYDKDIPKENICDYILNKQSQTTANGCLSSIERAITHGVHVDNMVMLFGDSKHHNIESTTINLNNNRVLKIILDKGAINNSTDKTLDECSSQKTRDTSTGLNILFVDDDAIQCKLYSKMLSVHDCEVTTFNSSLQALKEFENNHQLYDIVISDIIMPDLTGDKLAEACRRIKPEIPIILLSGYAEHLNKSTAKEFGVSHYLQKPVNSAELLNLLNTFR